MEKKKVDEGGPGAGQGEEKTKDTSIKSYRK